MNAHALSGGAIAVFAAQVVSASPAGSLPRACTHAPAVSSGRAWLSSPRRSTCPAGLSRPGSAVLRHDSVPKQPKTRLKRALFMRPAQRDSRERPCGARGSLVWGGSS